MFREGNSLLKVGVIIMALAPVLVIPAPSPPSGRRSAALLYGMDYFLAQIF